MSILPALSQAQWAMLDRLVDERLPKGPWVDTSGFDHRTLNSLVARDLAMRYPYSDRPVSCLTPSGTQLVFAHRRHRNRLRRAARLAQIDDVVAT